MAVELAEVLSGGALTDIYLGGTDPANLVLTEGGITSLLSGGTLTDIHLGGVTDDDAVVVKSDVFAYIPYVMTDGSLTQIVLNNPVGTTYLHNGSNGYVNNAIGSLYLNSITNGIIFQTASVDKWELSNAGHLFPYITDTYSIGSVANRVKNIYLGNTCYLYFGATQQFKLYTIGSDATIIHETGNLFIRTDYATGNIVFQTLADTRWLVGSDGTFYSGSNNQYDIGKSDNMIRSLYVATSINFYTTFSISLGLLNRTSGDIELRVQSPSLIKLTTNGSAGWEYSSSDGTFRPSNNGLQDLGASTYQADNIYCVTMVESSDEVFKEDIQQSLGLDFILQLSPKSYKSKIGKGKKRKHGLIAQEVSKVITDLNLDVSEFDGVRHDEETGTWGLAYSQFIAPIINAIKELNDKIDAK